MNSGDSESGSGGGGGDGTDRGRRPRRSEWKSWRESPTAALLGRKQSTGNERTNASDDDRDGRQPSRAKAVSEMSPAPSPLRDRKTSSTEGNGKASRAASTPGVRDGAAISKPSAKEHDRSGLGDTSDASRVAAQVQGRGTPRTPQRQRGGGGVSLVPRVATLAMGATVGKSRNGTRSNRDGDTPTPAKRAKDFDPDNLECVRRHEASVAERAREAQSARAEVERRSKFRALPLPSFRSAESCGAGVGVAVAGGGGIGTGGPGRNGGKWLHGSGLAVATSDATTRPGLMSALEQARCKRGRNCHPHGGGGGYCCVAQKSTTARKESGASYVGEGGAHYHVGL